MQPEIVFILQSNESKESKAQFFWWGSHPFLSKGLVFQAHKVAPSHRLVYNPQSYLRLNVVYPEIGGLMNQLFRGYCTSQIGGIHGIPNHKPLLGMV